MGRPFDREISWVPETVGVSGQISLGDLPQKISEACLGSVILIGTGGSLSAAEFCHKLFENRGVFSQAMTTLAFLQSKTSLNEISVIIFTAGGNNKDILATFVAANKREAKQVIVVCASKKSKIADLVAKCEKGYIYSFSIDSGRDGYLATNSLIATCIILARAFGVPFLNKQEAEEWLGVGEKGFNDFKIKISHLLILHSSWSKLAAVDMESKLSEAGLAASMLADYRHFAHGRHNWIDKQQKNTAIISFQTKEDLKLATATLKQLPKNVYSWSCKASAHSSAGALQLLLATFGFINAFGKGVGIDPGRPGVPNYGSKLYSLGPVGFTIKSKDQDYFNVEAGTERKFHAGRFHHSYRQTLANLGLQYVQKLTDGKFGALVADFDGTILPLGSRSGQIPKRVAEAFVKLLKHEIPICISTGRGDSIHDSLIQAIPESLRDKIYIGYYNGAFHLPLSKSSDFERLKPKFQVLDDFESALNNNPVVKNRIKIRNKACQVSIESLAGENISHIILYLQELISSKFARELHVAVSSHSIDILPLQVSKQNSMDFTNKLTNNDRWVLALGDCGALGGNDFELLQHPYSLSVDKVSGGVNSCWNFLPPGVRYEKGTEFYLERIEINQGYFSIAKQ